MESFLPWSLIQQLTSLSIVSTLSANERTHVLLAVDPLSHQEFVLKIGHFQTLKVEHECLEAIGSHPNLVQLKKSFRFDDILILQFEKVSGSTLTTHLLKKGSLPEERGFDVMRQLVSVVSYIHSKGWVHRDLKPDNIIFDDRTNHVKVIDFEFACRWSNASFLSQSLGTFQYSAPEIRACSIYKGPEVDVWSLGVTLFVITFVRFPFSRDQLSTFSESSAVLFSNMSQNNTKSSRPVSPSLCYILSGCLEVNQLHRAPLWRLNTELNALCQLQRINDEAKSFPFGTENAGRLGQYCSHPRIR